MSIEHEYKQLTIIDYDVEQVWLERVSEQLRPCLETSIIADGTSPLNSESHAGNFSKLIQFDGLHKRLPTINGEL